MIRQMKKEDLTQCGEIYAPAFRFYEKNGFNLSQGTVCIANIMIIYKIVSE